MASSSSLPASPSTGNIKSIEDILQCPICFEVCESPKILKYCGHYFCLKCLTELYAKSEYRGLIRCPLCNYRSKLVINGVFGQKKTPKPQDLRKLLPDCRTLRLLGSNTDRVVSYLEASELQEEVPAAQHSSVISRLFICKICRRKTSNHRMLPFCQHSFCLKCLQSLYSDQNSEKFRGSINCPTCHSRLVFVSTKKKKNMPPPPVNVIGNLLPVDYALSNLLSILHTSSPD